MKGADEGFQMEKTGSDQTSANSFALDFTRCDLTDTAGV
jgi:hypothetical protein